MISPRDNDRSHSDFVRNTSELVERARAIESIRRGLADVGKRRTQSAKQAFAEIRLKHKIPRRVPK
jgi:hypothetical protein